MRKLLSAEFSRLWRCKVFWLSCAFLAVTTVAAIWIRYSESIRFDHYPSLDRAFFYYVLFIAFLIPVVCALFIGVEYADGTVRNKIVCGHSKVSLYLSNLILCSAASLLMCTAAVVPGLCVGLPLIGGFDMGWPRAILFFVGVYTLSLAWTALFTLLTMLAGNRTISAVAALLLSLVLLMMGAYLETRLDAKPTTQGYTLSVNGELVETEKSPNPLYLPEGPVRDTVRFLSDFTPGGQTLQHINQTAAQPEKLIVYDAVLFIIATGLGLVLFRRKDLK